MTPLFIYLLKVNAALVLFYLAYHWGLRRLTFYTLNRIYLLFAVGFSSLYPLLDTGKLLNRYKPEAEPILSQLPNLEALAEKSPSALVTVLTAVFWAGVAVMGFRFLMQLASLAIIHMSSSRRRQGAQDIRMVRQEISPFSFFRSIYINPSLHQAAELDSILKHEAVHVREWHTLDILAGELNRVLYWFNPGAWLMLYAIRENLEFITDRKVLKGGVNATVYQYSLLKVGGKPSASPLVSHFNLADLKIRITMMNKKPSSDLHLLKYLVLVPLLAFVSLAFNTPGAKEPDRLGQVVMLSRTIQAQGLQNPDPIGTAGSQNPAPTVFALPPRLTADSLDPASSASTLGPTRQITRVEYKKHASPPSATDSMPPPSVRVVKWDTKTAASSGSADRAPHVVIVDQNPSARSNELPLIVLNDKEVDYRGMEEIAAEKIESYAIDGASGRMGKDVSVITGSKVHLDTIPDSTAKPTVTIRSKEDPLIIVNGKVFKGKNALDKLDPNKIKSVSVVKDKAATDIYGEKGKHGVIQIDYDDSARADSTGIEPAEKAPKKE